MARRTFTQVPYQYGDGKYGVAIGQTRDGVEELVTLSGQMVLDETTGLWVPVTTSNRLPVEATLSGRVAQGGVKITTFERRPILAAATTETSVEITKACVLDYALVFAHTGGSKVKMYVEARNADGTYGSIPVNGGISSMGNGLSRVDSTFLKNQIKNQFEYDSVLSVNTHTAFWLRGIAYDDQNDRGIGILRHPGQVFPFGFRVIFENTDEENAHRVGIIGVVRELEV